MAAGNDHNVDTERTPLVKPAPSTPFPWRPASALFFLILIQPLAFELIFPFISEHPICIFAALASSVYSALTQIKCFLSSKLWMNPRVLDSTLESSYVICLYMSRLQPILLTPKIRPAIGLCLYELLGEYIS
jgi:hypothetical protein